MSSNHVCPRCGHDVEPDEHYMAWCPACGRAGRVKERPATITVGALRRALAMWDDATLVEVEVIAADLDRTIARATGIRLLPDPAAERLVVTAYAQEA